MNELELYEAAVIMSGSSAMMRRGDPDILAGIGGRFSGCFPLTCGMNNFGLMAEQLLKIATLFRVTAAELRRLARGPIRTERDTIVAVEAYLHRNQVRTAEAFPPDQCLETANLLEEFADKLQALSRPPRH